MLPGKTPRQQLNIAYNREMVYPPWRYRIPHMEKGVGNWAYYSAQQEYDSEEIRGYIVEEKKTSIKFS